MHLSESVLFIESEKGVYRVEDHQQRMGDLYNLRI